MNERNQTEINWQDYSDLLDRGIETLPQLLLYQAGRWPDRVFHRRKDFGIWQRYTWQNVLEQVQSLAGGLLTLGIKRDDTVALVGENEPQLFWSEYAAQAIGAKVVCLYPDLTSEQMQFLLNDSDSVLVICEDQEQVDKVLKLESALPDIRKVVYWDDRGMWQYDHPKLMTLDLAQQSGRDYFSQRPHEFEEAVRVGKGSDIAVLSYTSGTTGLPKGCMMTHNNLFDTAFRVIGSMKLKANTQYLSYISPAWGTEQMFGLTMGPLVPFVVNFPEEPDTVQQNIREIGTEALMLGPRQWENLASLVESKMMEAGPIRRAIYRMGITVGKKVNIARLEGKKVPLGWKLLYPLADWAVLYHLRDNLGLQANYLAVSGGTGMAPDVFRFFHALGVKLRNVFGTTEMGLLTSHQGESFDLETVGGWYSVHPKLGSPLEWKFSEKGELLVKGGSGFQGYYKKPEATAEAVVDGWYYTGDAVNMTDKNELVYLDRLSDMRQLSTGHSYPPQFIETRLRFSPYIKEVMTLGNEQRPFVSAFINIDADILGIWAEKQRIGYTTYTDLSQNPEIRELIKTEIERINYFLADGSKVKRFITLPKELDPDEDELTRSRKLRRKFLEQKYIRFITAIYDGEDEFEASVPVKYQDGKTGILNALVFVNSV